MKIGILTFHCALNYGAILQTYALQSVLSDLGHEVYVLDYRPKYLLTPYKVFRWQWSSKFTCFTNIKYLLRQVIVFPVRLKRKLIFKRFIQKNINLCCFSSSTKNTYIDAFILGSDQIWNPSISNGFDEVFFGHFPAACGKKIISYAASVGSVDNISPLIQDFNKLLKNCTNISVREKSLVDCLNQYNSELSVSLTLDPVLLAGRKIFDRLIDVETIRQPYLLCFQISFNKTVSEIAHTIAKSKGLEVIELVSSSESVMNSELRTCEKPEEFISLFASASYVLTSSFHGTAFSILYSKDFNIVNFDAILSERMMNLLSMLGLADRLVTNISDIESGHINYADINKRLEKARISSKDYLNEALS